MNAYAHTDAGDRDAGDYCPSEVSAAAVNVWHPSFVFRAPPPPPAPATESGRAALRTIKLQCHSTAKAARPAATTFKSKTSWTDTPDGFKRLLARSAGLELDVCAKRDRDLTEEEKAAIRKAAGRLLKLAEQVFAI